MNVQLINLTITVFSVCSLLTVLVTIVGCLVLGFKHKPWEPMVVVGGGLLAAYIVSGYFVFSMMGDYSPEAAKLGAQLGQATLLIVAAALVGAVIAALFILGSWLWRKFKGVK